MELHTRAFKAVQALPDELKHLMWKMADNDTDIAPLIRVIHEFGSKAFDSLSYLEAGLRGKPVGECDVHFAKSNNPSEDDEDNVQLCSGVLIVGEKTGDLYVWVREYKTMHRVAEASEISGIDARQVASRILAVQVSNGYETAHNYLFDAGHIEVKPGQKPNPFLDFHYP